MTHFFQIVINHIVYFSEVLITVQYICVICIQSEREHWSWFVYIINIQKE